MNTRAVKTITEHLTRGRGAVGPSSRTGIRTGCVMLSHLSGPTWSSSILQIGKYWRTADTEITHLGRGWGQETRGAFGARLCAARWLGSRAFPAAFFRGWGREGVSTSSLARWPRGRGECRRALVVAISEDQHGTGGHTPSDAEMWRCVQSSRV